MLVKLQQPPALRLAFFATVPRWVAEMEVCQRLTKNWLLKCYCWQQYVIQINVHPSKQYCSDIIFGGSP